MATLGGVSDRELMERAARATPDLARKSQSATSEQPSQVPGRLVCVAEDDAGWTAHRERNIWFWLLVWRTSSRYERKMRRASVGPH